MSTSDHADRAARGAALLDRVRPGWAREIDQNWIDIGTCHKCILGQLYGDFGAALNVLHRGYSLSAQVHWSCFHGFNSMSRSPGTTLAALADAWRAEIRQRLEAS